MRAAASASELELLEVEQVPGTQACEAVVSPDGAHVYAAIGSFAIDTFERDPETGMLSLVSSVDGPAISRNDLPDGKQVYAVGGAIWYDRDPVSGSLTFRDNLVDPIPDTPFPELASASAVAVSPDGRNLYVTAWETSSLIVLARDEASFAPSFVQMLAQGKAGVDGLDGASSVEVSPDGRNVYATGSRDDVASFARDPEDGTLTFLGVAAGSGGIAFESAVAISPDGRRLYVGANEVPQCCWDALSVFGRDLETGELTLLESVPEIQAPNANGLDFPSSAVVSPDGLHLYVSSRNSQGVAAFRIVPLCAPEPLASCRASDVPAASTLVIHDRPGEAGDTLDWQWRRGEVPREELGDPRSETDFALCAWVEDGGTWRPIAEIPVRAASTCNGKPCWPPLGGATAPRGFVYRDPRAEHGGLRELALRAGTAGRGRIRVHLKGDAASVPDLPLEADQVVAQLASEDGACWQSTFAAPALANDAKRFRDRGD